MGFKKLYCLRRLGSTRISTPEMAKNENVGKEILKCMEKNQQSSNYNNRRHAIIRGHIIRAHSHAHVSSRQLLDSNNRIPKKQQRRGVAFVLLNSTRQGF